MKSLCYTVLFLLLSFKGFTQDFELVIWMTTDSIVDGMCDTKFALAWDEKQKVVPRLKQTEEEIYESVDFLTKNEKLKAKGMIIAIINCEGKMVTCDIIMEADQLLIDQLTTFFMEESTWNPAIFSGKAIDAQIMSSIKIKKGKFSIE